MSPDPDPELVFAEINSRARQLALEFVLAALPALGTFLALLGARKQRRAFLAQLQEERLATTGSAAPSCAELEHENARMALLEQVSQACQAGTLQGTISGFGTGPHGRIWHVCRADRLVPGGIITEADLDNVLNYPEAQREEWIAHFLDKFRHSG